MGNRKYLRLLLTMLALLLLVMGTGAQNSRSLQLGVQVNGEITADIPAQIYTLNANDGDLVNVAITSQPGLSLSVVISDASGNQLASASDNSNTGGVSLSSARLAQGANYFVIFATAGSSEQTGGYRFQVDAASGDAAPTQDPAAQPTTDPAVSTEDPAAPTATPEGITLPTNTPEIETVANDGFVLGQVLTTAGLRVTLDWASTADLNLELRDPTGQRLFFDSRTNQNGGTFGFDVNGLCEVLTPNAQETATYSPGSIPAGSYEILVYYRQNCENNGVQTFTINVEVDGVALAPVTGTLQPPVNDASTVFISSFIVNLDGTAVAGASGPYQDTRFIPATLANALPTAPRIEITDGVPVRGIINAAAYYDLYSFTGIANQVVSIGMTRLSGNLDTLLLVLDPAGQVIAANDDIVAGNVTDSAINNPPLRLPADGTYTIVATRYGKDVGGTAGEYDLLLQGQSIALPQEIIDLGLPTGDIQVTLTWNTNADLQLLVRDPAGMSVYDDDLEIPSGGRMSAQGNLNCVASLTTPVSHIYWPSGLMRGGSYEVDVWYQNQCNDTRPVNAVLYISVAGQQLAQIPISPQPNQHFVTSFLVDTTGRVTLGAGGIVGGVEQLNYTTELETAPLLTPNQVARNTIDGNNVFDVYTFQGAAGNVVDIRMTRTTGNLDTSLFLISPSFFELTRNDDASADVRDSLIDNFTLPEDGLYIILATRFATVNGGTTGAYELSMTLE